MSKKIVGVPDINLKNWLPPLAGPIFFFGHGWPGCASVALGAIPLSHLPVTVYVMETPPDILVRDRDVFCAAGAAPA